MNEAKRPEEKQQYADSTLSAKAYKNMIIYGVICPVVFFIIIYFLTSTVPA